jgi:hypothetical protein
MANSMFPKTVLPPAVAVIGGNKRRCFQKTIEETGDLAVDEFDT